jgi:hypothetical protein
VAWARHHQIRRIAYKRAPGGTVIEACVQKVSALSDPGTIASPAAVSYMSSANRHRLGTVGRFDSSMRTRTKLPCTI